MRVQPTGEKSLTPRQREIFKFIRKLIRTRGYGPTIREIGYQFGIRSPNGVMTHLHAMEKKKVIERDPMKSRAITLVEMPSPLSLPYWGECT